jgi:hypothetical protein
MSTQAEELRFWQITTEVSNNFFCVAGKTRSDLQDASKYKTKIDAPFELLIEILDQLRHAVIAEREVITVAVEPDPAGGYFIVPGATALKVESESKIRTIRPKKRTKTRKNAKAETPDGD